MKHPLFTINIDETNALFTRGKGEWLKDLLVALTNIIVNYQRFVFIILTGTHATSLIESILESGSGAKYEDVALPLLNSDHAKEVILEMANRGLVS